MACPSLSRRTSLERWRERKGIFVGKEGRREEIGCTCGQRPSWQLRCHRA